MFLLLLVFLSIALLRLNCAVLQCLFTYCTPIKVQIVGLPLFSKLKAPKSLMVVFCAANLEGVCHGHKESAEMRVFR